MRAPRTVCGRDVEAFDLDLDVLATVEEMIDGFLAVPAGNDHGRCPEFVNSPGELSPGATAAGKRLRLEQVRRDDRRERKEPGHQDLDSVVLEQLRARARHHHRVDYERQAVVGE